MSNVINQMTTSVNLLKGMNVNSVVDIVHDEVVIDVSETMTKEEAISFGNMWLEMNEDAEGSQTYQFFKMAISALSDDNGKIVEKIIAECDKEINKHKNCRAFSYAYGICDMAQVIKDIVNQEVSE